ncbi:MAG TPA: CYTH domain-containing protein [Gemmatimonadaceae bacterium]|nr:CYTH domain-containing protein [Gemmatimonadaceae bacterium]
MREVELKAVVDSMPDRMANVERAGGRLVFRGRLEDCRYDTVDRQLRVRDDVLRLRVYRDERSVRAELGWKGPTRYEDGYKVRDEIAARSPDADALRQMLDRIGFVVTREIDRDISQYELNGATVRFERYPRMDDLVEVEGDPGAIERAIEAIGLPREAFTSERLFDFVRRWQERTGEAAALCDRELSGEHPYALEDA